MNSIVYNGYQINYEFVLKPKNKKGYMQIEDGYVRITAPVFDKEIIEEFLMENAEKIIKIFKTKAKKNDLTKITFEGVDYELKVILSYKNKIKIKDKFYIYTKKNELNYLKIMLDQFYVIETSRRIAQIFNDIYNLFQNEIPYPTVECKKLKSCYGYCIKKQKKIVISSKMAYYSIDFLKYVLIHELCHLKYPNHQEEFYKLFSKILPNHKEYRKYMKDRFIYDGYY